MSTYEMEILESRWAKLAGLGMTINSLVSATLTGVISPRDQSILLKRFLTPRSLNDIGVEFGLTRERIRQIEGKSLNKIKVIAAAIDQASSADSV